MRAEEELGVDDALVARSVPVELDREDGAVAEFDAGEVAGLRFRAPGRVWGRVVVGGESRVHTVLVLLVLVLVVGEPLLCVVRTHRVVHGAPRRRLGRARRELLLLPLEELGVRVHFEEVLGEVGVRDGDELAFAEAHGLGEIPRALRNLRFEETYALSDF